MRLAFFVLLLVSLALLAGQRGVFGSLPEAGREPERSARQIAPERIVVLTHDDVQRLRDKIKDLPVAVVQEANGAAGCLEFGDFAPDVVGRVVPLLSELNLGERLISRAVELPGWFMVYIPPYKSRAEVDQRAEELKKRGLKDMLVIADNSAMRFGISLGSFRDREAAQKHRAELEKRGVKDARVSDNPSTVSAVRFQVRSVDIALAQRLAEIQKAVPASQLRPCVPE